MPKLSLLLLLALLLTGPPRIARAFVPPETAAAAAKEFLALYDRGDYTGCWQAASETFRQSLSLDEWTDTANRSNLLLGAAIERTLERATPLQRMPGFPDGDYLALLFRLRTERKHDASELVILHWEEGRWQVARFRRS